MTRSRKVESLRLNLSFYGTNYHRLHLFARQCYTLHAFIEMRPFYSQFAFRRNWNESTKMLPKISIWERSLVRNTKSSQDHVSHTCMQTKNLVILKSYPKMIRRIPTVVLPCQKKLPTATLIIWILMISYSIISLHIWFLVCILLPINIEYRPISRKTLWK